MDFDITLREAFLQYLQMRGILDDQQLHDVLNRLWAERRPIGHLALETGILTIRQVNEILLSQHESDSRFGEQAIKLGYLDQKGLERLLLAQRECGPGLKDILFEMELVDEAQYAVLQIDFLGKTADALV